MLQIAGVFDRDTAFVAVLVATTDEGLPRELRALVRELAEVRQDFEVRCFGRNGDPCDETPRLAEVEREGAEVLFDYRGGRLSVEEAGAALNGCIARYRAASEAPCDPGCDWR